MRKLLSLVILSLAVQWPLVQVSGASGSEQTWERVQPLLHFHDETQVLNPAKCAKTFEVEGVAIKSCAGLIDSFDGLSLSVAMQMPAEATEPLPTLLYLHGSLGTRGEFVTTSSGWGSDLIAPAWAADGYAVVMPNSRGNSGSCGFKPATGPHAEEIPPILQLETPHGPDYPDAPSHPDYTCSRGWSHLGDRDYEIRDYQTLLGRLVDAGVSDPDRLGVIGPSYGGTQAWTLATAEPWLTPSGSTRVALAAAVPLWSGTSVLNAFAPNGRANDEPEQDRSIEKPFGVVKDSLLINLFGAGQATRYNHVDPSESESYLLGWIAAFEKGEPYDTPDDHTLDAAALAEILRRKSAYFSDGYFAGLEAGTIEPVPILAVQGWNDPIFTAVEALQMYRKLKAVDPEYPISMFLGDVAGQGNGRGFGTNQVKTKYQGMVRDFLDSYLLDGITPEEQIVSMSTECAQGTFADIEVGPLPTSDLAVAPDWDSIHPGLLTLKWEDSVQTKSGPSNLVEEVPTDPGSAHLYDGCIQQGPGSYDEGVDFSQSVPPGGATLLGLPKLMADYVLDGEDATVVAKLWDVDEQGRRTLVTRGVYRLSLAGGDELEGTMKFQLFGNHYRFIEGHSIELEISQTDYPFLRVDDLPSTIEFSDVKLELPTTEIIED